MRKERGSSWALRKKRMRTHGTFACLQKIIRDETCFEQSCSTSTRNNIFDQISKFLKTLSHLFQCIILTFRKLKRESIDFSLKTKTDNSLHVKYTYVSFQFYINSYHWYESTSLECSKELVVMPMWNRTILLLTLKNKKQNLHLVTRTNYQSMLLMIGSLS